MAMATACPQGIRSVSTASPRASNGSLVRTSARISRADTRGRAGARASWVTAAATDDTLEHARANALPIAEALDATAANSVPSGPAVFALLDGRGPDATVMYVGVSKRAAADVAAVAEACAAADVVATHCAFSPLPATARRPRLKAALGAWLERARETNGATATTVPVGNAKLASSASAAGGGKDETSSADGDGDSGDESDVAASSRLDALAWASAAVTDEVIDDLCANGFVILDDVCPDEVLTRARIAAECLRRNDKMKRVGQEGRDDSVIVLDAAELPSRETSEYGGLTGIAELLLAFPEAFRTRIAKRVVNGASGVNASASSSASASASEETSRRRPSMNTKPEVTRDRLRSVQPPSRLMLAHYAGDASAPGARYLPHIDNDPDDPGHAEGTPGLRACDRAVTVILYLNENWEAARGGCLRVQLEPPKKGVLDVAPTWGRVVAFDSRRVAHEVRPTHFGRWAMTAWLNDGNALET